MYYTIVERDYNVCHRDKTKMIAVSFYHFFTTFSNHEFKNNLTSWPIQFLTHCRRHVWANSKSTPTCSITDRVSSAPTPSSDKCYTPFPSSAGTQVSKPYSVRGGVWLFLPLKMFTFSLVLHNPQRHPLSSGGVGRIAACFTAGEVLDLNKM